MNSFPNKSDFAQSPNPQGILVSEGKSTRFGNTGKKKCESEAAEITQSNVKGWHCTVLEIQSFWRRKLPAHAPSDPRPSLKQNVITTDMSSTLSATETLSFLPALSCFPSSVVLERHQRQITPAERSSLSSSAAY